jgi:hypothetical protein
MTRQYATVGGGYYGPGEEGSVNPFLNASAYLHGNILPAGGISGFVREMIGDAAEIVEVTKAEADKTIKALANSQLIIPSDLAPPLPELLFDFDYDQIDFFPDIPDFGEVPNYSLGPAPKYTGDTSITVPNIPPFNPSFTSYNIEDPPPYIDPDPLGPVPTVPTPVFPPFTKPPDPKLPIFSVITLPEDPEIVIPPFEAEYPEFNFQPPNTAIEWTEPQYTPEIIDDVILQIEKFLAGGTSIRPDVQEAMNALAGEREDRIATQAVQEVVDAYAARGFTLPPGLMQKRVDAIRFDRDMKKQGISRDILIKTMDVEIENLRFAVTAGIQAEELYVRIFLAATERAFFVARYAVEYALQLHALLIEVFRVRMEEVKTKAIVYRAQVDAALAQVEIFKALIEAELAKVQIDQAKVDLYVAQIEAIKTYVEIHALEVRTEAVKLEAVKIEVEAFSETVDVYTAQINANKVRFDAYDSQVRGELGKANIVEAESRGYAAQVQGIATGVSAEARALEAGVSAFGAEIQAFIAETTAERDKAQVQLAGIQANVAGYEAATQRYVADSNRYEALARIELAAWNAGLENQLGYYRALLGRYEIDGRLLAEQARIALGGLEAAGGMETTIIGGALAAMHVGATISGSGGVTSSGSLTESYSSSRSSNDSTEANESIMQGIDFRIGVEGDPYGPTPGSPPWGAVGSNN